jgi:hypothetical protein
MRSVSRELAAWRVVALVLALALALALANGIIEGGSL